MKRLLSVLLISAAAVANALTGSNVVDADWASIIQSAVSIAAILIGRYSDDKKLKSVYKRSFGGGLQ